MIVEERVRPTEPAQPPAEKRWYAEGNEAERARRRRIRRKRSDRGALKIRQRGAPSISSRVRPDWSPRESLLWVCAVKRRRFPVGASPTRRPLQPEATGAGMEVTKCLKPSDSGSRNTVTARVCRPQRE